MNFWPIMIVSGLLTFATRLSFIWLVGRRSLSPAVQRGLRFVPPAVLSAIIVPEMLLVDGQISFALTNPRLLAGLLAALVAWRTRSALWTIAAGLGLYWVLLWLGA